MNNLTLKKKTLTYTFWGLAGLTFTWRVFEQDSLNLIFTPLLSLILIYDYHRKIADDQALYFSFFFCMLGDIMTISSDFYYFTSGLIAYWGASILFYFTLNRELEVPFRTAIKKPSFFLPFLIYGLYCLGIMTFIRPYLGSLFIPILIYGLSLSLTNLRNGIGCLLAQKNNTHPPLCKRSRYFECNCFAHWDKSFLFKKQPCVWSRNTSQRPFFVLYLYVF